MTVREFIELLNKTIQGNPWALDIEVEAFAELFRKTLESHVEKKEKS